VTTYKVLHKPLSKRDDGKGGEWTRFCNGSKTNEIRIQKLRGIDV